MSLTLFDPDTKNGNDGAPGRLPLLAVGTHNYQITDARVVNFQDVPLGVAFKFKRLDTGEFHENLYGVFSSLNVDTKRIAQEKMRALWDACGFEGPPTLDRLPAFIGSDVEITVTEHKEVKGKIYAQISTTNPVRTGPAPVTATPQYSKPTDPEDTIPMEHPTDTPAATSSTNIPWPQRNAARKAAEAAAKANSAA